MAEKKSKGQKLAEELLSKPKSLGEKGLKFFEEASKFCEGYKDFLANKTEREAVEYVIPILKKHKYTEYVPGKKYKAGEKFYMVNRGKDILMCTKGKKPVSEGIRVAVAHLDSPRLDFKPHPLFEDGEMVYFKTHYYGGIKKYQWTTVPMSIRGVVMTKDGKKVTINVGENDDDPSFIITDLLVHLARDQMQKTASKVVEGEQLNLLIGSWPFDDKEVSQKVKLAIMNILHQKYGIVEDDFESAELCAVPAFKARDLGFDRSLIAGYGQDDSSCAYAEFMAEINTKNPEYTTLTIFADKEETGSDGVTGMASCFFRDFVEDLAQAEGCEVRHVMRKSLCLSADVGAGYDPAWPEVFERNNCAFMNYGPILSKYDGAGGKYSTNDASAEVVNYLHKILRDADVTWQMGELGKIDVGGGGTIASYISLNNIDTIDIGVPVLSMHAPVEVVAKADEYMLYKAIYAVYNSKLPKEI